jgi:hypothetical protein
MMVAAMAGVENDRPWDFRQLPFLSRRFKVDKIPIRFPRI